MPFARDVFKLSYMYIVHAVSKMVKGVHILLLLRLAPHV